jgi:hypothetical protein
MTVHVPLAQFAFVCLSVCGPAADLQEVAGTFAACSCSTHTRPFCDVLGVSIVCKERGIAREGCGGHGGLIVHQSG